LHSLAKVLNQKKLFEIPLLLILKFFKKDLEIEENNLKILLNLRRIGNQIFSIINK